MTNKHILVVGGSRGIGKAFVKYLIKEKQYNISVFGRSQKDSYKIDFVKGYQVDVTDMKTTSEYITDAVGNFGKINSIIFMQRHRGNDNSLDDDYNVSVKATKNIIDYLLEKKYFHSIAKPSNVIIVSSISTKYIAPEQPLGYHIAKSGINQLARFYALKLGQLNIKVNVVSPCVVLKNEAKKNYKDKKILVERYSKYIPLGRMGTPDDISEVIMFLIGDRSNYITGQNIVVDGGLTLRSHESLIRDITDETHE